MKKLTLLLAAIALLTSMPVQAETHTHNPYRQVIDSLTEEEREEFEQVMYLEAGTDEWEGRLATAQVMLNRVLSDKFPDTMHLVLSQRNPTQYSTYRRRHKAKPGEQESDAIEFIYHADLQDLPLDLNRLYQDCRPIGKRPIKVGKQYFGY